MSIPSNPDTIIVKNEFYPHGLREIDLWDHYQKYKKEILKEVQGRDLFFVLKVGDEGIVYRHGKISKFIRLNESNYDKLISGRTLSIHSTMKRTENIMIVDIDAMYFPAAKEATMDVYNLMKTEDFISNVSIRFTGKSSFHIFCNLKIKANIDLIRKKLKDILTGADLSSSYTIDQIRKTPNVTNLDLSPDKFRGGFITLGSLSLWGLKCMEVKPWDISDFKKEDAKIGGL